MSKKLLFVIIFLLFLTSILSGCRTKIGFSPGNIKDDYCGVHLNAKYCKCAFHNDFCDDIGMSRSEAKKYVDDGYDNWVGEEKISFQRDCRQGNGIVKGSKCIQCYDDEVAVNDECLSVDESEINQEKDEEDDETDEGECKYDSDCDPICEGNTMWKMGCNARTNTCEKTFDTNCEADIETFGELSFPKVCSAGECARDIEGIEKKKAELVGEKKMWSDTVKEINSVRDDIREAMLDANKNCINGIADMTNVAIMEFATRVGSVLAGGIPDVAAMTASAADKASGLIQDHIKNLAGAAVDYVGEGLNRLYNYQSGEPAEEDKKLAPHEYIKLNCDLYDYFKGVQAESDNDLQTAIDMAKRADEKLKALP